MSYSLQFAARNLLYVQSHRLDSTNHTLCYTSCGVLAVTRNSSMGPLGGIDIQSGPTYRHIPPELGTLAHLINERNLFNTLINTKAM